MQSSEKLRPLLRRPESSNIDVADFSFGKPASHKPFSLRTMPKQPPIVPHQIDTPLPLTQQTGGEGGLDRQLDQPDAIPNTESQRKEATPITQDPVRQLAVHQSARRFPIASESRKDISCGRDTAKMSLGAEQVGGLTQSRDYTTAETPRQNTNLVDKGIGLVQDRGHETKRPSEADPSALTEPLPMQKDRRERENTTETQVSRVPLKPANTQLQASKRRRAPEIESNVKHQTTVVGAKHSAQLSEDDLFELLIQRMKQREENEHSATLIQRQIENQNMGLKEQNHVLQDRLKKCQGQLAKVSSESRAQRAQLDKWKEKLFMFKGVLNELGREYGTVKEYSRELKEVTVSLDREKNDIHKDLVELKLQVLNNAETAQVQRDKLSNSETTISKLREALHHSERRGELIKTQLSSEKRRIVTLETYIQNESQSQARYLALVRNDQRKMAEKFDSACELFTTSCAKSQYIILSKLEPALEKCADSVQGLSGQCGIETTNVQEFTKSIEETNSSLKSLATLFASDIDRGTEMNKNVLQALQKANEIIETNLGPCSPIFGQLSDHAACCGNLQQQLQVFRPMLDNLGTSVKAVGITETDLVRGLETFGQKLTEARIPAGNPVLEMEVSKKFAENAQLELSMQQTSMEIESLRKQLGKTSSDNQDLQHALTESVTNEQTFKSQISRLEIEKTALRGEYEFLEQRIREELGTANTKLQDQMKARFEEQIQNHETEKMNLKRDCVHLQAQLESVRNSLAESERSLERERSEKAATVREANKQIDELNDACSKYITEAQANEIESNLLRNSEAGLREENDRLLEQLEALKGKATELESSLAQKTESDNLKIKVAQDAETRANLLELETAKMTEELKELNETLAMLKSRSSALEKVGEEANSEIVSLLRRAQEAESWQVTIREGFARVIDVQSDEPFEQTWQKLEKVLQSSLARPPITRDTTCAEPQNTDSTALIGAADPPLKQWEGPEDHLLETDQADKGERQTMSHLPSKIDSTPGTQKIGIRDDSPSRLPPTFGHIVPFSSVCDRLSREDSLSLFNDPTELEMLFMSTPDLHGGPMQGYDTLKGDQQNQKFAVNSQRLSRDPKGPNSVTRNQAPKEQENESQRAPSAVENVESSSVARADQVPRTKRKMVSFKGTRIFTETEFGRERRMSDATDNSSGRESESKPMKKTQKRTYSRLRQSVAQEESAIETTTDVQPANKTTGAKIHDGSTGKAGHSSNISPRPPKRPRDTAHGSGRRLSPKGLASGSSRSNPVDQAGTLRGRGKRRTRGDKYDQRFNQDAG